MKLYGYWRSSATWRVRIALACKGIAHDYQPVHLLEGQQHSDAHRAANPMQQVPVLELEHDGRLVRLSQSLAILEYLEERFPEPALLPADPILRANVRQLAEMVNSGIQPLQNLSLTQYLRDTMHADERPFVQHWVGRGMAALEAAVAESAGRYAVGDAVTFADCCLVPQLYAARRFKVDVASFPTLLRIEAACMELPAFQRAHADRQPDAVKV
jgi:maleylpyruvate isomerase